MKPTRITQRLLLITFALLALAVVFIPDDREQARAAASNDKRGRQAATSPTFNQEVVRLLQKSCQTCHHPGDIAPFSMITYKETRPWAKSIREQVILRQMPPWKPVPGCGNFLDARQLTDEEIATFTQWVDAGAPEGDPADLPPARNFPDGWPLGEPDLILTPESDYTPPTTSDLYRCFTVPTSLRGDRYISAIDVRPGNRKIVHHIVTYIDRAGVSAELDARDPGPGYTSFGGPGFNNAVPLSGWAPGARAYFFNDGVGVKLPNNSRVVFQIHYHPTGQQESDRTQVGLYFAKAPVRKQLQYLALINEDFAIPPGEGHYPVTASYTVPSFTNAHVVSVTPHMHLLGREMKVEATPTGQPTQCLININDWNFQWQGTYSYQEPVALTAGTKLQLTAFYDNSAANPRNPNSPPRTVRWGEQTTDEMCIAALGLTLDAENLPVSSPQINEVTVDQNNNLVVTGSGFLPGADIEIDSRTLRDTRADAGPARLMSNDLWRVPAPPGQSVSVTVLNPDGARTAARSFTRPGSALLTVAVSAARYSPDALAPEEMASAFGVKLATDVAVASALPLPTELGGTSVRVNGVLAPLFFVAPQQINFLIPSTTQTGTAVIEITAADGTLSRGDLMITTTAPSLFTANAQGTGAPAAVFTSDGLLYSAAGNPDGTPNPIHPGDYLILFGTGIRRAASGTVKVTIGGVDAPVFYAGGQGGFVGLDQVNTQIPTGISGVVEVALSINGRAANVVKVLVR